MMFAAADVTTCNVQHSGECDQGRREKIRAPGQRYNAGPLGTEIQFSEKKKVLTSRRRSQCTK